MARQITYNEELVKEGLLKTFLEKGYAEASLAELETNSGLNRRQLYNNFGDKKALFMGALKGFETLSRERILFRLERGDLGIQAIDETLLGLIEFAKTPEGRLGCLFCNTARESIAADPDIGAAVSAFFGRIENAYASTLKRALELGELEANKNIDKLSRYLMGIHVSLCVLIRGGQPYESLKDIQEQAMISLR